MNRAALITYIGIFLCGAGGLMLNSLPRLVFRMTGLVLLYLGGSVLLLNICSLQMCLALFVCGIGVTVLLWTSGKDVSLTSSAVRSRLYTVFRLLISCVLGVLAFTSTDLLRFWIPVRQSILFISVWTFLMSFVSLCLDDLLLYRCLCLQSLCLAFMVCYIYMENSILVFAFFAVIHLLLAFAGAVLTMKDTNTKEIETEVKG